MSPLDQCATRAMTKKPMGKRMFEATREFVAMNTGEFNIG